MIFIPKIEHMKWCNAHLYSVIRKLLKIKQSKYVLKCFAIIQKSVKAQEIKTKEIKEDRHFDAAHDNTTYFHCRCRQRKNSEKEPCNSQVATPNDCQSIASGISDISSIYHENKDNALSETDIPS